MPKQSRGWGRLPCRAASPCWSWRHARVGGVRRGRALRDPQSGSWNSSIRRIQRRGSESNVEESNLLLAAPDHGPQAPIGRFPVGLSGSRQEGIEDFIGGEGAGWGSRELTHPWRSSPCRAAAVRCRPGSASGSSAGHPSRRRREPAAGSTTEQTDAKEEPAGGEVNV